MNKIYNRLNYLKSFKNNFNNSLLFNKNFKFQSNNNNNRNKNENNDKKDWKRPFLIGSTLLLGTSLTATTLLLDEKTTSPKAPNEKDALDKLVCLKKLPNSRERIIVLGTGWASLALIKNLDLTKYEIIVISPRNHFIFTPMLTTSTVGSVETRSIIEPIRRVLLRLTKQDTMFIEALCTEIDYKQNEIIIKEVTGQKQVRIPYDKLVIGVGCVPNSFGTKGVEENCVFIKEATDAQKIRDRIMTCFEKANFPGLSEEEIRKQLNCVVVGGGPSGVELSGEIYDLFQEDLKKMFPKLIPYSKITMVQSANHLLNTFDSKIIEFTEKQFNRDGIETLMNSRVIEVKKDAIVVLKKGDTKPYEIPFGMCVWATGVGPSQLTKTFCETVPEQQHNRAISVDPTLKVIGIPNNNIYAIGDCSTISQDILLKKILTFFKEADTNNDNQLSLEELRTLFIHHSNEYPQMKSYLKGLDVFFHEFDINGDNQLQFNEFKNLMTKVDANLTTLPATAQCANQEGIYLAHQLNKLPNSNDSNKTEASKSVDIEPFKYKHAGSFAYIGHKNAVADIPNTFSGGGYSTWWVWNAVYLNNQFSWRNRFLVTMDRVKSTLFGRDISRI
ncbi:calcium-binding EF-hand domain-containing protein [Tieghemostelium lacteum]|uniref:Calcium-binding EF-hand domain-containing protein n=1 Tax=Tieghemostelium lacteum TaxID=361077 RepID=A0A151ZIP4_TIELA|nr:calcium-binding EF-hand domain-containing protein [Tieghemostelium lacteum]|eukprot:KYQ93787.1 calcium-binding EF-hand domain-containing protein [Tieghemostelium lacteum]